jgi:HEPN domain-containing protein
MKENKDVARGWMLKAESDIENLMIMMERGKSLDTACFHAQQAAEKYLKAFLSSNDVIFPRTHDIEELLGLCAEIDKRFSDLIAETTFLTDYAVELRYDVEFWPGKEDARAAFEAASRIRQLVLSILPEDIHPFIAG